MKSLVKRARKNKLQSLDIRRKVKHIKPEMVESESTVTAAGIKLKAELATTPMIDTEPAENADISAGQIKERRMVLQQSSAEQNYQQEHASWVNHRKKNAAISETGKTKISPTPSSLAAANNIKYTTRVLEALQQ